MVMKITVNPDEEYVKQMREGLKMKNGHCPCLLEQSENTICMCKNFRDQTESGWCHCNLYYKEIIE